MSKKFNLLMLGAMYENGGNVHHRLLDGHPEMFVYPFESQLGTRLVSFVTLNLIAQMKIVCFIINNIFKS